jgi:membrane protease YdiL (CAAX protease family)
VLLGNACVFTALMHSKGLSYRQLFHSSPSSVLATAMVLVPAIALTVPALVVLITSLLGLILQWFPLSRAEEAMFASMGADNLAALIMGCVLAPVLEEMLFRGIVLRSFLHQYTRWAAILGSATLFGFVHMNLYQFAVGVVIGVFLGWLYERTRSLVPCIALHASYNTTLTVISLSERGDGAGTFSDLSMLSYAAIALLGGAGLLMLRRVLKSA